MKARVFSALVACALFALLIGLFPELAFAQSTSDYVMFETQYLKIKAGQYEGLREKLGAHNKRFHSKGAYAARVFFVTNGARTGDLVWVMGPTTFTDLDGRPAGDPHDSDWVNEVLSHCEAYNTEYWTRDEELSYFPATEAGEEPRPLRRTRFFEVADNALFVKVQGQIKEVIAAMGSKRPRLLFRKQFQHRDGRDWAAVSRYKNWAELDEETANFEATFKKVHGVEAWDTFRKEFDQAVVSREDEWRQPVPELNGSST